MEFGANVSLFERVKGIMFKVRMGIAKIILVGVFILLAIYPAKEVIDILVKGFPFFIETMPKGTMWPAIDKIANIKEDLVGFAKFCRENIPPEASVVFFMSQKAFKKRYGYFSKHKFMYIPFRLRYYLYPIKMWGVKDLYKEVSLTGNQIDIEQKKTWAQKAEYIIGIDLEENFPGFVKYKSNDFGMEILKRE